MKHFYLIIMLFGNIISTAQLAWFDEDQNPIWTFDYRLFGNFGEEVIGITEVTTIGDSTRVKLSRVLEQYHASNPQSIHSSQEEEYLYQVGAKIYYYNKSINQFQVIYNFDLEIGETYTFTGGSGFFGNQGCGDITLQLDSLKTTNINGETRRIQYLSIAEYIKWGDPYTGLPLIIVEGIGMIGMPYEANAFHNKNAHLLFPIFHHFVCSVDPPIYSFKSYQNSSINFQADETDLLNYTTTIPNIDKNIQIFPNPTIEIIHLDYPEEAALIKIEVQNITGQTLSTYHQSIKTLNLSALDKGIYFINFHFEKGISSKKVIKN